MNKLFLRSMLIALLVGPTVEFISTVALVGISVRYDPPITQAEFKEYQEHTVAQLDAFMKSREVKLTRSQYIFSSIQESYFWKNLAKHSIVPCLGIFLACILVATLERRDAGTTSE